MAQDPFPNSSEPTTEQRFRALFLSSDTVIVTPTEPLDKKDGLVWVNTETQTLNVYFGGITWTTGLTPAMS